MTITQEARYGWIDATKGIGIILVAFCHIYFEYTRIYIYSFLIPLFFILSGMLYKQTKYTNTYTFAKQRAKSLLYPYFIWSLILFGFWAIADSGDYSITKGFIGVFYGVCQHDFLDWGMMMWFIPTLYITEITYDFISRKTKRKLLFVIILTILGYAYSYLINNPLPWGVNISFVMLFFYHIGKISFTTISKMKKNQFIVGLPILIAIYIITSQANGEIYSEKGEFQNLIYYILSGTSGTFMLVFLFNIINLKYIQIVGQCSLLIMILHLRTYTTFKIFEEYILNISHQENLLSALIFTTLAIIILTASAVIIKKHFRFLIYPPRLK